LLFVESGLYNKHFFSDLKTVQYTGRSDRVLLHQTVEDGMQFAVGIRLCWHVLFATQVPSSLF